MILVFLLGVVISYVIAMKSPQPYRKFRLALLGFVCVFLSSRLFGELAPPPSISPWNMALLMAVSAMVGTAMGHVLKLKNRRVSKRF